MSYAFRCAICAGDPAWRLERIGDAITSWTCDRHLAEECDDLQRSFERTVIQVTQFKADDQDDDESAE